MLLTSGNGTLTKAKHLYKLHTIIDFFISSLLKLPCSISNIKKLKPDNENISVTSLFEIVDHIPFNVLFFLILFFKKIFILFKFTANFIF